MISFSSPGFKVRRLMIVLAVLALILVAVWSLWPAALAFIDSPYGLGRTSGLLSTGQAVVLSDEFHAAPAGEVIRRTGRTDYKSVMYDWPGRAPVGKYRVAASIPCIVTIDPAWDEDSCSEERPIAVKLGGGPHREWMWRSRGGCSASGSVAGGRDNLLRPSDNSQQ